MKNKEIEVIGLGALNMDYAYRVPRILVDGEGIVEEATSAPGGSTANTICRLAKLGVSTGLVGAVGDDPDGKAIIADFDSAGVDTSRILTKKKTQTGSLLVLSDSLNKRSTYVSPGANSLLGQRDVPINYLNKAGIVHVSSFADDAQLYLLNEILPKLDKSVKLSFSPGPFWAAYAVEYLMPILSRTDILFTNADEIARMTGFDARSGAAALAAEYCETVVVTLGKGVSIGDINAAALIVDCGNETVIETGTTKGLDLTGEGDAFAAGFLFGRIRDYSIIDSAKLGAIQVRFSSKAAGSRKGLPSRTKLLAAFKTQKR